MRGVLVDALVVVVGVLAVRRDGDLPVDALGLELLGVPEVEVVPVDREGCLALLDGGEGRLGRDVIALLLELLEEVEAGLHVVERPAVRQRGREDGGQRGAGLGRVPVERDLVLVLGLQQVLERLRAVLHGLGVAADRHVAAVVVQVRTVGLLLGVGDAVPAADLVRGEQLLRLGLLHVRGAEVERVDRPVLALALGRRVEGLLAAAAGVLVVDLDSVLLLEGGNHLAVVRPVGGQGVHVQRALLLRLLDETRHPSEVRRR